MNIKTMVDRFLCWKLPKDFSPDCHISFDREKILNSDGWPIGTNLLTAYQAEEMLRYVMQSELSEMNFGEAIEALKDGKKVARAGWNGKGLSLRLISDLSEEEVSTLPYVVLCYPSDAKTTPGAVVPWLASQTDMLAEDWTVVE